MGNFGQVRQQELRHMIDRYRIIWMSTVILAAIAFIFTSQASAAAPTIAWNKSYQFDNYTYGQLVIPVEDGYLLAPTIDYWYSFSLIKTDYDGNVIWNRTYETNWTSWSNLHPSSAIMVRNGYFDEYLIFGIKSSQIASGYTGYMAKIDQYGDMILSKFIRPIYKCNSVIPVSGGYIIAGSTGGYGLVGGHQRGILINIDLDGNPIWNRTYPAPGAVEMFEAIWAPMKNPSINNTISNKVPDSWFNAVIASDDGYVLAGVVNGSAWLVKTDLDGNETWNRTYGAGWINTIVNAGDGYVFINRSHLMKTDEDGNVVWEHQLNEYYPGSSTGSVAGSLVAVPDGYVMAGLIDTSINGTSNRIYLIKTDRNGNMIWNATYVMGGENYVYDLIFDQGAYVITGNTLVPGTYYDGIPWLLKTSKDNFSATPAPTARPARINVTATPTTQTVNQTKDQASATPTTPALSLILTTLAVIIAAIAVRPRK
jgi:hypothetical protein